MHLYGFHPVRERLRHRPQTVAEVLLARRSGARRGGARGREIEDLCRRHGVVLKEVNEAELSALVGAGSGTHNGIAAVVEEAAAAVSGGVDTELQLLVEDVQDPRNLGALLRVCEGAGVGRVLVRDRGSAPLSAAAARTAAGAADFLDLERITNSAQAIEGLKKEGFWVYGAAAEGQAPWDLDLTGKVLLCVGGEEKGLRARTRKLCDALVGLPMRGRVASLNLATAASALLYEAVRQRTR